jgi:hypothetical protein
LEVGGRVVRHSKIARPTSEVGQTRTLDNVRVTSVKLLIADSTGQGCVVVSRAVAVAAVAVSNLRRSRLRRCGGKLFGSLLVSRAGHGIDNCDGDRHLYVEAGGQKHTQWLAPVSRAASPYPSL